MRGGLWRKSINGRKGSRYRDYDAAFGKFHRISKCFHRRKQNLYVSFSLQPGILGNLETIGAWADSTF
jgi:hypothetical protein